MSTSKLPQRTPPPVSHHAHTPRAQQPDPRARLLCPPSLRSRPPPALPCPPRPATLSRLPALDESAHPRPLHHPGPPTLPRSLQRRHRAAPRPRIPTPSRRCHRRLPGLATAGHQDRGQLRCRRPAARRDVRRRHSRQHRGQRPARRRRGP